MAGFPLKNTLVPTPFIQPSVWKSSPGVGGWYFACSSLRLWLIICVKRFSPMPYPLVAVHLLHRQMDDNRENGSTVTKVRSAKDDHKGCCLQVNVCTNVCVFQSVVGDGARRDRHQNNQLDSALKATKTTMTRVLQVGGYVVGSWDDVSRAVGIECHSKWWPTLRDSLLHHAASSGDISRPAVATHCCRHVAYNDCAVREEADVMLTGTLFIELLQLSSNIKCTQYTDSGFYAESSYCFQRVLAIAILSVRPSVTRVDQSKTVQPRITKSSPLAAWKTLVSVTIKLFHKFEGVHLERGR